MSTAALLSTLAATWNASSHSLSSCLTSKLRSQLCISAVNNFGSFSRSVDRQHRHTLPVRGAKNKITTAQDQEARFRRVVRNLRAPRLGVFIWGGYGVFLHNHTFTPPDRNCRPKPMSSVPRRMQALDHKPGPEPHPSLCGLGVRCVRDKNVPNDRELIRGRGRPESS
jgi:hypothetical protein